MLVNLKRLDLSLPLPSYQTTGAVAFDLYSRETLTVHPHSLARIPTNLIIKTPPGYMLVVVPRSSTPERKGLLSPHGIGIIDQDYCGLDDEILLQVYNFTGEDVVVERGERIGQATFVKIDRAEWEEQDQVEDASRGGFGSTA